MEFNKQAIKELNKLLHKVVKELDKILKLNDNVPIFETVSFPKEEMMEACKGLRVELSYYDWNINLNENSFKLSLGGQNYGTHFTIARRTNLGRFVLTYDEEDKKVLMVFIKHYPEIREQLIKKVEQNKQKRNKRQEERLKDEEKTLEELRKLSRAYKNYSTVEIDMPQTNNQHQIEVIEEGNQKIGTINFGRQTIRIITEGDIVLVNKKDQKTKRR